MSMNTAQFPGSAPSSPLGRLATHVGKSFSSARTSTVQRTAQPFRDAFALAPLPAVTYTEASPSITSPTVAENKPPTLARRVANFVNGVMGAVSAPLEFLNTGVALATAPIAQLFPALPASTLTSLYIGVPHAHLHPPSFTPPATPAPVPLPSIGTVVLGTTIRVLINGMPAARAGDIGLAITCGGVIPMFEIFLGSSNVFLGGMRAARVTDICKACQPPAAGFARTVACTMGVAGMVAALAGMVADEVDAANEPDPAMASAMALAAAMGAASMAMDAATMAITMSMGTDMAVPPVAGALVHGHPNVLIGGFPMMNMPDPALWLLHKVKAMRDARRAHSELAGTPP